MPGQRDVINCVKRWQRRPERKIGWYFKSRCQKANKMNSINPALVFVKGDQALVVAIIIWIGE